MKKLNQCSYLLTDPRFYCQLDRGVYIPSSEHLKNYCQSSQFDDCLRFLNNHTEMEKALHLRETELEQGRRHSYRLAHKWQLLIYSYNDSWTLTNTIDENAYTVNLSKGGICLSTSKELRSDQKLLVRFGDDFAVPGMTEAMRVKWTKSRKGTSRFHSGLTFTNNSSGRTILTYVTLSS